MARRTGTDTTRSRVSAIVGRHYTADLVAAYFDPAGVFAGATFDGLGSDGLLTDNPPNRFTAEDITATSLLDVRFEPTAVRELLRSKPIALALEEVPTNLPLWEMEDETHALASRLWSLILALPGVGGTRTSKLLARKRPHLIPVVDSVITQALDLQSDPWRTLGEVLSDHDLRRRVDDLRPSGVSTEVSTLRLLDVAAWMTHSRSTAVVRLQMRVGAIPSRKL